ncbi:MAG: ATP-binding cassette domain-containing protein [Fimbriimonadaceae bacterium]|nr:ATP-binding cassette domain-containing protein [Fimbriimonadaceae bacterium]
MPLEFRCRHRYASGFALDVAFGAGDGVTALCGPSGSGKTTVLMLVAGLLRPERGRIVLGGDVLGDTDAGVWLRPERRKVGLVFQDSLLFPHLSVRENLEFGRRRRPGGSIEVQRVLDVLELGELVDRAPATLSGGQARRVALGRTLLSDPDLLMLDEPWTGLDESLQERAAEFVQRCMAEWKIPTLLVAHDRAGVHLLADQIVELREGQVAT